MPLLRHSRIEMPSMFAWANSPSILSCDSDGEKLSISFFSLCFSARVSCGEYMPKVIIFSKMSQKLNLFQLTSVVDLTVDIHDESFLSWLVMFDVCI